MLMMGAGEAPPLPVVYAGYVLDGRTHVFISYMQLYHTGLIGHLGSARD